MRRTLLFLLLTVVGCHRVAAPVSTSTLPAQRSAPPTASLLSDRSTIDLGTPVVLSWHTSRASSVSIDGIGPVPLNGIETVSPSNSTSFHLVARGEGGTAEANLRVAVRVPMVPSAPPPPPAHAHMTAPEPGAPASTHPSESTAPRPEVSVRRAQPSSPVPATRTEYPAPDEAEQMHLWIQKLRLGTIDHHIATQMKMGEQYSASVTIHPISTAQGAPGAPVTEANQLRISPFMRVELGQQANPGTFDIKPDQVCKLVSLDSDTPFNFTVKPLTFGSNKVLQFTTYVLYGNSTNACSPGNLTVVPLESYRQTVLIGAIDPAYDARQAVVAFLTDPMKWVEYILPGGAGFALLAKLVDWWRKRKRPPSPAGPSALTH